MKQAAGVLGKFFKKGFLSPPMLLVKGDSVTYRDKTYLFEKNPDPELIKKLSVMYEGEMIRIEYYHFDEDKDVRITKSVRKP